MQMHFNGLFALVLVNVVVQSASSRKEVSSLSEEQLKVLSSRKIGRIVNGTQATLGQFPHQVSLRYTWSYSHFCGGIVIDEEWILTAAHCFFLPWGEMLIPGDVVVFAGDLQLIETSATSQERFVDEFILHEMYNGSTLEHDIAVIKLSSPLNVNTVAVHHQVLRYSEAFEGALCQVAGWGAPEAGINVAQNNLMYVNVPIFNHDLCRRLYVGYMTVTEGMMCAGYMEGMKDACQGDSGGGLICDDVLTGIVSAGEGCAWPTFPGIYTDVRVYRDWILDTTGIDDRKNVGLPTGSGNVASYSLRTVSVSLAVFLLITRNFGTN